jgi:hypothetical protein
MYEECIEDGGQCGVGGLCDGCPHATPALLEVTEEEDAAWEEKSRKPDPINSPSHYQSENGIECIDAIRAALGLEGFVAHCRGTAIKYCWRSGKKQKHAEDLRKAAVYLNWAADALEVSDGH